MLRIAFEPRSRLRSLPFVRGAGGGPDRRVLAQLRARLQPACGRFQDGRRPDRHGTVLAKRRRCWSRADWTEAAQKNFRAALMAQKGWWATTPSRCRKRTWTNSRSSTRCTAPSPRVFVHHMMGPALPTKGRAGLDPGMVAAARAHRRRLRLFFWIRDSYASAERKVAIVAMALLVALAGGSQTGYASWWTCAPAASCGYNLRAASRPGEPEPPGNRRGPPEVLPRSRR